MTADEVLGKIEEEKIKVVLFDFDNTICDLRITWDEWDRQVGELMRMYDPNTPLTGGYMRDNRINAFIEKYGEDFRSKWRALSNRYEEKYIKGCNPRENVLNVIRKLKGVELWIWSSNSEHTVKKYLTEMGIIHLFSTFITRDSVDFIKPDSDGFKKHILPGTEVTEYLMIGNSSNDRNGAKGAGILYIDEKDISV